MIFPLELTAFEEYMLADDRPAYPMAGFLRLRFSGCFDPEALECASREAFGRHPLLAAVVRQGKRGRWEWVGAPGGPPPIEWVRRPKGNAYPPISSRIDLNVEPGVRLLVAEGEGASDLVMHLHHAACDGLGAFQFFEDLLIGYAKVLKVPLPRPLSPPIDPTLLRQRGRFGLTFGGLLRLLPRQVIGLTGVRKFLQRTPLSLGFASKQSEDASTPHSYPAAVVRQLGEKALCDLQEAAARLGATSNELLVRNLFLALDEWKSRYGSEHPSEWLRLSIPMNLRTLSGKVFPATNIVSMIFLDRRPPAFHDPQSLLEGIRREMQLIKRNHLEIMFLLSLGLARLLPGGLNRSVQADRCSATCVFSNFGSPLAKMAIPSDGSKLRIGDLVLESADALPPLRPFTAAAMTAITYAGRMSLSLHYDPCVISTDQAESLLETFVGRAAGNLLQWPA